MVKQHYRWDFIGLSTDEKPTSQTSEKVVNGSTFYCSDTSKLYVYCDGTWYERKPLGGGGGPAVVQTTGTSTTDVMSQNAVTEALSSAGPTIVQTTGTSTTNVMSQNAVTESLASAGPTISQTTGSSTTDVMSQNATAKMVYDTVDNTGVYRPKIGNGAFVGAMKSMAIGDQANASEQNSTALGGEAFAVRSGAIALGYGSRANSVGEMNIGSSSTSYGYNSSKYRLLTGLYDPQNDHDAATKKYVDDSVSSKFKISDVQTPDQNTQGNLGDFYIYIDDGMGEVHLYICVFSDLEGELFAWSEVGSGTFVPPVPPS